MSAAAMAGRRAVRRNRGQTGPHTAGRVPRRATSALAQIAHPSIHP